MSEGDSLANLERLYAEVLSAFEEEEGEFSRKVRHDGLSTEAIEMHYRRREAVLRVIGNLRVGILLLRSRDEERRDREDEAEFWRRDRGEGKRGWCGLVAGAIAIAAAWVLVFL